MEKKKLKYLHYKQSVHEHMNTNTLTITTVIQYSHYPSFWPTLNYPSDSQKSQKPDIMHPTAL